MRPILLEDFIDIYSLLLKDKNICARNNSLALRQKTLIALFNNGITKVAFDTRRIDQETQIIPRRALQHYSRSNEFITIANAKKLNIFKKLKTILEEIKNSFAKQVVWQDSYCRILLDTIDRALRTNEKDGDITDSQPGVGSLDYLEEMIYVRYRLSLDALDSMNDNQIKTIILSKDPELNNPDINNFMPQDFNKSDIRVNGYDALMDKLFGNVKASIENPNVERTITITIKDRLLDK